MPFQCSRPSCREEEKQWSGMNEAEDRENVVVAEEVDHITQHKHEEISLWNTKRTERSYLSNGVR